MAYHTKEKQKESGGSSSKVTNPLSSSSWCYIQRLCNRKSMFLTGERQHTFPKYLLQRTYLLCEALVRDHTGKEVFTCLIGSKRTRQWSPEFTEVSNKAHIDSGSLEFTRVFKILNASVHHENPHYLFTIHLLLLVCKLPWPERWEVGERSDKKIQELSTWLSAKLKRYLGKLKKIILQLLPDRNGNPTWQYI